MDKAQTENVWYLAYGSNMSTAKFEGSRGIVPLAKVAVKAPGWYMAMLIPGLAYKEPASSAIETKSNHEQESGEPDVHGVAYLITSAQHRQVIASEGGGTAYINIKLVVQPLSKEDMLRFGDSFHVVSLGAGMSRRPPSLPSMRYMDLIVQGAKDACLPIWYIEYLNAFPRYVQPESGRAGKGRKIFLAMFSPVFDALETLTKSNIQPSGFTYGWIILIVRGVVLLLWIIHDQVFSPIFGRGDGLIEQQQIAIKSLSKKDSDRFRG